MKKILFIVLLSVGIVSCSSSKRTTVKMPKWKKEHKASKKEIKNYTKEFVKNLYDSSKVKDTTDVEIIFQN